MALDPLIGGGLISTAGSLFGNLLGNIGAKRRQKRADDFNIKFWNMQNEYNHPKAQLERLRDAGLNPNLIYGTSPTSAVGNAGQIAPSKAADYNIDNPLANIELFSNVKQKSAQTDNLVAQNNLIQQETALKHAQTAGTLAGTAKTKFDLELANDLRKTSVDYQKESLRKLELETVGRQLDNSFKSQAMRDQLKRIMYDASYAKEHLEGAQLDNVMKKLDIELKKIGIEKNDAWYFRILGRMLNDENVQSNFKK